MSTKISQLTSATDVTANDLIQIVDVEDGVMAPSGTNKKATAGLLANQLVPLIDAGAIAGSKIADSGITSAKIADGTIVNADINSSAAIAGTKVSPNFGEQNIVTTGTLLAGVGSIISGSSSTDAIRITQTGSGNSILVEDSTNPDNSPFVVDANGTIIAGFNQKPSGNFEYSSAVSGDGAKMYTISGHNTTNTSNAIIRYSTNTTSSNFTANVILAKSNTQTIGDHVAVSSDQPIGQIGYFGSDGTNFVRGAAISSTVDGSVSANSVPMRLAFATRPSGSAIDTIERMVINSNGDIGINTNTLDARLNVSEDSSKDAVRITQTGTGNAIVVQDSTNPDSSPFVVNQHGSLQIGFNQFLDITGYNGLEGLQLSNSGTSTTSAAITMSRWSADSGGPVMTIGKSRGVGTGNRAAIQSGDQIGAINFAGDDGGTGDFPVGARILASADGTTGVGDLPSRLQFSTTPDGASAPVEAMRINSAGNVGIGATSIESSCLLKLESTTKGFRPPSMTTTERNAISPIAGLMIYNNTTNKLNFYNGSAWEAVTSSV